MIDDDRDWLEGTGLEEEGRSLFLAFVEGVACFFCGIFMKRRAP